MYSISRRVALKSMGTLCIAGCTNSKLTSSTKASPTMTAPWAYADKIIEQTTVPSFPEKDFPITNFGAIGDAKTDNSVAFKKAISACSSAGGGRVIVDNGIFLSGPIHLESNVNLHITKNTTIRFHSNPKHYLPEVFTRWEGMECMGYSPLIYAYGKENIAVTGKGTVDGQGEEFTWWPWKGNSEYKKDGYPTQKSSRDQLFAEAEAGVNPKARMYGDGHYLRPSFIQPYHCKNVLIEGIRVIRAPFWLLHPVLCENVTIRGVHLNSLGPNSDGCDPESCRNVVIENCLFDTGDDCIAIKSGRNNDGRRINTPTENVVIRNCKMLAGHGGIVIGSEISGGVRNVFAENNVMSSPDLLRGIRIKTNSVRGGILENIYIRNCNIGEVRDAIVINFHYEEGDAGKFDPIVRNVEIRNLVFKHAKQAFKVRGFSRAPIQNFRVIDTTFIKADRVGIIENVDDLKIENVTINEKVLSL